MVGHRISGLVLRECNTDVLRKKPGSAAGGSKDLEQDPGCARHLVHSGLWPFSTLGCRMYLGTAVLLPYLSAGQDVISFFSGYPHVFMALEFMPDVPFEILYSWAVLDRREEDE